MPVSSVRLPQTMWDALAYEAKVKGVSRNRLIRDLLVTQLPSSPEGVTPTVEPPAVTHPFRCPILTCELTALSEKAICPIHGRTVIGL